MAEEFANRVFFMHAVSLAPLLQVLAYGVGRPHGHCVGRVIEQLTNHLAAYTSVRAALDLDKRWDPLAIQEEVIEGPTTRTILFRRQCDLAPDEQPTAFDVSAISGEKRGVFGEERL